MAPIVRRFHAQGKAAGASWLGLAVSIVSLGAVAWWIAGQESPRLPQTSSGFAWLAAALVVIAANFGLRAWRWHWIMRHAAIRHRDRDALGLTLVGYMGNNVLPARGGDLLKIGLLGLRTPTRRREILGSVIVERVLDATVLAALFAALTWARVRGMPSTGGGALVAVAVLAAAAAGLAGWTELRRRGRFERIAAALRPVAGALRVLARPQGAPPTVATLVIWCIDGLTFLLICRAVEVHLAALPALAVIVLASLAAAIPAAPGYVGTFDAAMLLGLHAAGVAGGVAVGVLLLARFMFFVPVTIAGLCTLVVGYGTVRWPSTPAQGEHHLEQVTQRHVDVQQLEPS